MKHAERQSDPSGHTQLCITKEALGRWLKEEGVSWRVHGGAGLAWRHVIHQNLSTYVLEFIGVVCASITHVLKLIPVKCTVGIVADSLTTRESWPSSNSLLSFHTHVVKKATEMWPKCPLVHYVFEISNNLYVMPNCQPNALPWDEYYVCLHRLTALHRQWATCGMQWILINLGEQLMISIWWEFFCWCVCVIWMLKTSDGSCSSFSILRSTLYNRWILEWVCECEQETESPSRVVLHAHVEVYMCVCTVFSYCQFTDS